MTTARARRAAVVLTLLALAGCAAPAGERYRQFAEAGQAYVKAVDALVAEAAAAAVDADSAALAQARDGLDAERRADVVLEHDQLLRQRMVILDDLRRHAALLEAYFASLAALAAAQGPHHVAGSTAELVGSLEAVGVRLRDAQVGQLPVDEFTGTVLDVTLAGAHRAALRAELQARAPVLRRELDTQRAAVQVLAETMRDDLEVIIARQELADVVEPYREGRLARIWTDRRRELITGSTSVAAAEAAILAAGALQEAFDDLLAGRFGMAEYATLVAEVNRILTLIEAARGLRGPEPGG